ncbi:diguanylate cyclase (GGDEF)-like protein [Catenulispora sp. GAS73]|uniref:GGDEF domain-containing protein n=1 Tax=Catenulispora sp. GAS73 TaxID=3156269 RepID=UPI003514BA0F
MLLSVLYPLAAGVNGAALGAALQVPRLRRSHAELTVNRWLAEHDPLTRLPNRAGLRRQFEQDRAAGQPVTMALIDLDDFKSVNDTWGHQAGDALLNAMAARLSKVCPPGAFPGRLAGDEFLILLPWISASSTLAVLTEITSRIRDPLTVEGPYGCTGIVLCASAGLASLHHPDDSWSALLRRADIALYHAKQRRTGPVVFTPGMFLPNGLRSRHELIGAQ